MKIWIFDRFASSPLSPGGIRHYALARELIKRGHQVAIFAADFDHVTQRYERLPRGEIWRREEINGVPFVWIKMPPYQGNSSKRIWSTLMLGWRMRFNAGIKSLWHPNVIIGSTPELFVALAAERLARTLHCHFVLEVRDIWPQTIVDILGISPLHPFILILRWIERYLYRQAEWIISVLPNATEYFATHGGTPEKVVWVPNGIDLDMMPIPRPPPNDGVFTLIFAGGLKAAASLDTILDAAAILQNEGWANRMQIRFVGDGPEKAHLQRRASAEGLSIIHFQDALPPIDLYPVLRRADAFILTMRNISVFRHGISTRKLFDYMAMARPVIFAVNSANDPVAEAGAGLSIPPDNPVELARAARKLYAMSTEERWEMSLCARRYIEENHDYTVLVNKLERMLLQIQQSRHEEGTLAEGMRTKPQE